MNDKHTKKLVTDEHCHGVEELYVPIIECPICKKKMPARDANFCNNCGQGLKLSKSMQDWLDSK